MNVVPVNGRIRPIFIAKGTRFVIIRMSIPFNMHLRLLGRSESPVQTLVELLVVVPIVMSASTDYCTEYNHIRGMIRSTISKAMRVMRFEK